MRHTTKIVMLLFALLAMVAIVAVAMLYIAPITHADTSPTVDLNSPANTTTNTNTGSSPTNTTGSVSGASGLVVCTGAKDTANPNDNRPICNFNYFLQEGQHVINWLFVIAIPIAMVLFAYGGILYMFGTPGNRSKAKGVFTAAGIGFGIMLIAWVSVYTVVNWLTTGTNSGNASNPVTSFLGQQNSGQ
ncbi:MAG: pilin [Candidatus Pacebacteria bacterium]|nr:pilin [Candidatus Paceibacterota bacterium]